jgi:cytochrome c551/c552/uncharacterized protein YlxW (UPF0749 family)
MPASETFSRNLKTSHIVFAVSSFALMAVTFWMMADDYSTEWREHQIISETLGVMKLRAGLEDATTSGSYQAELTKLNEQIEQAEAGVKQRQDEIDKQQKQIDQLAFNYDVAEGKARTRRAFRDVSRAGYDLAVRDELPPTTLAEKLEEFTADQATVDQLEKDAEVTRQKLDTANEKLGKIHERVTELKAERSNLESRADQIQEAIYAIVPEYGYQRAKRGMLDLPILDGFSQVHRIQLDWLPDLLIKLGMVQTARFDRCRTCHISIGRVEAGNVPMFPHGKVDSDDLQAWVDANKFPHPYATHPRPELYLTAASPHPVQTFGCTICHDGQGSATNFNNAQHGPSDPRQQQEWEKEYHHHYNHFWEYPMLPKRFQQASCLKCHHDVVELGVNPKFGASAPKLYRGYQLLQKYGCFGCHEIHGFTGEEAIGPDLRLEPNYNAAALELLENLSPDRISKAIDDAQAVAEIRLLANKVAETPVDSAESRQRLQNLIVADSESPSPLLPANIHRMAEMFKDVLVPGRYRKVGPSLRYIANKTTPAWIEHWTEEPKRFRPNTRMPQFFGNTNQQDPHAAALMPVELTALAQYLIDKSQPFELLSPEAGYQPDSERGKKLFSQQGCLACHSHKDFSGVTAGNLPEINADFGPDLSNVHAKIRSGKDGFQWLYTWLRNPKRHHPRTKMPNLFLEQHKVGGETVDPAADIAAYLLTGGPGEYKRYQPQPYLGLEVESAGKGLAGVRVVRVMPLSPATRATDKGGKQAAIRFGDVVRKYDGKPVNTAKQLQALVDKTPLGKRVTVEVFRGGNATTRSIVIAAPLDDMVRLFLIKAVGVQPTEDFLRTRKYPGDPKKIKGDEIELVPSGDAADEKIGDSQWLRMKLNYVGRRTISRYGCYGCHDIPGFEGARPIGTTLQDWGRKDTSKLALEHIEEYLHHHGEPDGSSTHHRVELSLKNMKSGGTEAGEFASAEEQEREMSAASLYTGLLHHRREGFLWQKLRQPRSYDYRKIETKGYDERLRMPKFPFNEDDIEAISTFVLGLIAEPPAEQYIYQPTGAARARIDGEFLLEKYNCTGCHMLELPQAAFALELSDKEHPFRDFLDGGLTADEIAEWFVENRKQLISGDLASDEYPDDVRRMQRLGAPLEEIIQLTNDPNVSDSNAGGLMRLRDSVRDWMRERPQYMLLADLKPGEGEFPEGIARLLRLKPPVNAVTGRTRESGEPIISFHGLLMGPPDLEEDPGDQTFTYRSWETLDIAGRILLPNYNLTAFLKLSTEWPQLESQLMKPSRGGHFRSGW